MLEKINVDMLNLDGVSVKKQKYTVIDGQEYEIGQPHRRAYVNSTAGRAQIQAELQEPYLSAVLTVWGDTPTITEDVM